MTFEEPIVQETMTETVQAVKEVAKGQMMEVLEQQQTTETAVAQEQVQEEEEQDGEEEAEEEEAVVAVTIEQVPELVANGTQLFALGNYEAAVEKFALAVEALYVLFIAIFSQW